MKTIHHLMGLVMVWVLSLSVWGQAGPDFLAKLGFRASVRQIDSGPIPRPPINFSASLNGAWTTANGTGTVYSTIANTMLVIGQEYELIPSPDTWKDATFEFDIPPGYTLLINGTARRTFFVPCLNDQGVYTAESFTVSLIDSANGGGPLAPTELAIGNVMWQLGVGRLSDGRGAGIVSIRREDLTGVPSRLALKYTEPDTAEIDRIVNAGGLRQIRTKTLLTDMVDVSGGIEVRVYQDNKVQVNPVNGLYVPVSGAQPDVTYSLLDTSTSAQQKVKVTETTPTTTVATTTTIDINGGTPGQWGINENGGINTLSWLRSTEATVINGAYRTSTVRSLDANGNALLVREVTTKELPNPTPIIVVTKLVEDPAGLKFTQTYDYFENSGDPTTYGKLKWMVAANGAWERHDYWDSSTSKRGKLKYKYEPWLSAPVTPDLATLSTGTVTYYNYYTGPVEELLGELIEMTTTVNGVMVQKTLNEFTSTTANGKTVYIKTVKVYSSSSAYLTTVQKFYNKYNSVNTKLFSKIYSVTEPNGARKSSCWEYGLYDSVTGNFTPATTESAPYSISKHRRSIDLLGTSLAGAGRRQITSIPGGAFPNIDTIYLTPHESVIEVSIYDSAGFKVRSEAWLFTGAATGATTLAWSELTRLHWQNSTKDFMGYEGLRIDSAGRKYEAGYLAPGKPEWEITENGVQKKHTYDDYQQLLRTHVSAAPASGNFPAVASVTNNYIHDLYNRVKRMETRGEGEFTYSESTFDLSGRTKEFRSPEGVVTKTYYEKEGANTYFSVIRNEVVGSAGGNDTSNATLITKYHLDQKPRSVEGNGTVPKFYTYTISGSPSGNSVVRETVGSLGGPRWGESNSDWLGRAVTKSGPIYGNAGTLSESYFYDATHGKLIRKTTPGSGDSYFEYDSFGQISREGLDVDTTAGLQTSGLDRLTDHQSRYVLDGSAVWWSQKQSFTYPELNSSARILSGRTRSRVVSNTGTGNLLMAQSRSWGINPVPAGGDNADLPTTAPWSESLQYVDRTAKITESRGRSSTASADDISWTYYGMAFRGQSASGLIVANRFDHLLRLTNTVTYTGNSDPALGPTSLSSSIVYESGSPRKWKEFSMGTAGVLIKTAEYAYYPNGHVSSVLNAENKAVRFGYSPRGEVEYEWGDTTLPIKRTYDSLGQLSEMRTFRTGTTWNSTTRPTTFDTGGDPTTWINDPATGFLTEKRDAQWSTDNTRKVAYGYDSLNRLVTRTWARGIIATHGYDPKSGEQLTTTYTDGTAPVTRTYGRMGQLATVADLTGTRSFAYRTTEDYALADEGLPSSFFGAPVRNRPTYDGQRRLTGYQIGEATSAAAAFTQLHTEMGFSYNPVDERVSSITAKNRHTGVANPIQHTFNYSYLGATTRPLGYTAASTYAASGYSVQKRYEPYRMALNSEASEPSANNATDYAKFTYQRDSLFRVLNEQQTGLVFKNYNAANALTVAYTHDDKDQLIAANTTNPDGSITYRDRYFGATYDPAGNRLSASEKNEAGNLQTSTAVFNSINQLANRYEALMEQARGFSPAASTTVGVTFQGSTQNASHIGNAPYWIKNDVLSTYPSPYLSTPTLLDATINYNGVPQPSLTQSQEYRPYAEAHTYDKDGNLISDSVHYYWYDAENRLTCVSNRVSGLKSHKKMGYDYQSRRVQEDFWQGSSTPTLQLKRRFVYWGMQLVLKLDLNTNSGAVQDKQSFAWGLDVSGTSGGAGDVGGLLLIDRAANNQLYLGYDGRGNVIAALDAQNKDSAVPENNIKAAFEYNPFGELVRSSGNPDLVPFRYQTKWTLDAERPGEKWKFNLYDLGYRMYRPDLGRCVNRDPAEEGGGVNLYQYGGNSPITHYDYLGLVDQYLDGGNSNDRPLPRWEPERVDVGSRHAEERASLFLLWLNTEPLGPNIEVKIWQPGDPILEDVGDGGVLASPTNESLDPGEGGSDLTNLQLGLAYYTGFLEGALDGLKNEIIGLGQFVYGMTVGLGEQLTLTGMDAFNSYFGEGETQYGSAIFQGVYKMSYEGSSTLEIIGEGALQLSGYRFGNQIYDNLEYGVETGDYSSFSQNMGTLAGMALSPKLFDFASSTEIGFPSGGVGSGAGRLRLNIFGEGEAPGFVDVSSTARGANGRPLTSGFGNGSASDIFMRNAPITGESTIPEMLRLSQPGTRITLMQSTSGFQGQALIDAFGNRATVNFIRTFRSQFAVPGQDMTILRLKVRDPVGGR